MKKLIIALALLLSGCVTTYGSNYDKMADDIAKEKNFYACDKNTSIMNNLEKGLINQASKY